ncbi:HNH endonuclease signature motif containing protein [Geodermatophilus sp. Leaf369]|uniref:HNH endonuclease signature motif containing protein n=1 Tax=Geodermatophilus sp. Leaf369 TaxID=1736354 RepID=UPI0009EBBA2D|nr:HNH endonuclease signature motif containing protein [Geodermatophilus sp. Leaf369]
MSTMESPVRELAWFPPVVTSGGPLGEVQREATAIGRATAAQARAVAEFAALRSASADRQPGEPGCASAETRAARPRVLAEVSEWAAQELVVALQITQHAAQALLVRSLTLVHRLPATLEALEGGVIHPGHLWAFTERVGAIEDPGVRARVERELLTWMTGRVTTPSQLTERARVLVLRHDAVGAAQRLAAAVRRRGVFCSAGREDGLEQLNAVLTTPEARACLDALGRYADSIDDDPESRTRSQKMADCLVDLILRPGETGLPVVTAQLTIVAPVETLAGGDEPGEVDGQVVPAEMVRHLARALGLLEEVPPVAAERAVDDEQCAGVVAGTESPPDQAPLRTSAASEGEGPPGWAAADAAVQRAGEAVERARGQVSRARAAVVAAERAARRTEEQHRSSPAGVVGRARTSVQAMTGARAALQDEIGDLLRRTGGGGLADRPRVAVVDALNGTLLALTGAPELRRVSSCGRPRCVRRPELCPHDLVDRPGLTPPGATDGYRPGRALDRFVRARDRRCRFPGCRRRVPRGGELDHDRRWPEGPTAQDNLTGYCTGHHRGKHQAPGWHHQLHPDGRLTVTTPTGLTTTTGPPPWPHTAPPTGGDHDRPPF